MTLAATNQIINYSDRKILNINLSYIQLKILNNKKSLIGGRHSLLEKIIINDELKTPTVNKSNNEQEKIIIEINTSQYEKIIKTIKENKQYRLDLEKYTINISQL